MSELVQAFILGFIITALPGAVILETTRRALAHKSVMIFLAGNFAGIGLTIVITLFGVSELLKRPLWSHLFYILSGTTLLLIGCTSLIARKQNKNNKLKSFKKGRSSLRAFITGLILASANPISLIFWISMVGRYIAAHEGELQVIANCLAIVLGAALCFALVLSFTRLGHRYLHQKHMEILTDVFSVIIFSYGVFIISKAI